MRGRVDRLQTMFVAFDLEQHISDDHPLGPIKRRCDRILTTLSRDFSNAYSSTCAKGIPPESLLKCLLLRALFCIPSERRLCEACEYNVLYRWFIDRPSALGCVLIPPMGEPSDATRLLCSTMRARHRQAHIP